MKEKLLTIVFFIIITLPVFPDSELGFLIGAGYNFSFDRFTDDKDKISSYMDSPNIILNNYLFLNDSKIGLWVYISAFGQPKSIDLTINNKKENMEFDNSSEFGIILGPAIRYKITDNIIFQQGLGADTGIIFKLTNVIILKTGIVYSFDFYRYIDINASDERQLASGMAKDSLQFTIKPYILLGFNLYL